MKRLLVLALALQLAPIFRINAQESEPLVFVTESGRRYHRQSCPYVERSGIPITQSDAAALGYAPCGACHPPPLPAETPPRMGGSSLYRVNTAGLESYTKADLGRMAQALVVRAIDGDTVCVSMPHPPEGLAHYESVRLIGVDTPEQFHPRHPDQRFCQQSSEFTRGRLLHRVVYLAFDWNLRDNYQRLLAYIYLRDGSCHNADLIREGYGHAYTRFPFQFLEEFRRLERSAREQGRGLWARRPALY